MEDLLQGVGIFICVGALLLVALAFFIFRAITNAGNRARGIGPNRDWQEPGPERPRVDDPDIQSSGGFGGVPTTGERRQDFGPGRDLDDDFIPDSDRSLHRDRDFDRDRDRDRRRDDDDDVNTRGGFGG